MATTLVNNGDVIHVTTPTGGYTSGQVVAVDGTGLIGVSEDAYAAAATAVLLVKGVFSLTKNAAAGTAFAQGAPVYITSTGAFVAAATGNEYAGRAWVAATTTQTSVTVNINFGSTPVGA